MWCLIFYSLGGFEWGWLSPWISERLTYVICKCLTSYIHEHIDLCVQEYNIIRAGAHECLRCEGAYITMVLVPSESWLMTYIRLRVCVHVSVCAAGIIVRRYMYIVLQQWPTAQVASWRGLVREWKFTVHSTLSLRLYCGAVSTTWYLPVHVNNGCVTSKLGATCNAPLMSAYVIKQNRILMGLLHMWSCMLLVASDVYVAPAIRLRSL